MCFDARKPEASPLAEAIRADMARRDGAEASGPRCPQCGSTRYTKVVNCYACSDCGHFLTGNPPPTLPPRDGPGPAVEGDEVAHGDVIAANCARGHDGFAGSILADMGREREDAARTERARRLNAELEAKSDRWMARWMAISFAFFVVVNLILGWFP